MVDCKSCHTKNGLDAKFCKSCGTGIPDTDLNEALATHEQLTSEGYGHFNAGRIDQAVMIAQAAVDSNPSSPRALTLLAMCFERSGQVAEALETYERVLVIRPDSPLERLKVNQLRNNLAGQMLVQPRSQRVAMVAAGLVLLFAISVGVIISVSGGRSAEAATLKNPTNMVASNSPEASSFGQLPVQKPAATQPQNPATTAQPNTGTLASPSSGPLVNPLASKPTGQLETGQISPFKPDVPPGLVNGSTRIESANEGTPTTPQNINPNGDPPPAAEDSVRNNAGANSSGGNGAATITTATAPPEEQPTMEVRVSEGKSVRNTSANESSVNGVEALTRAARQQFQLGKYESAAKSYEKALSYGADPASVNQKLGMCYEKLGRNGDAAAAYSRAAQAYEAAISSGHGDSARLKNGLASCRQAIKVLKG